MLRIALRNAMMPLLVAERGSWRMVGIGPAVVSADVMVTRRPGSCEEYLRAFLGSEVLRF